MLNSVICALGAPISGTKQPLQGQPDPCRAPTAALYLADGGGGIDESNHRVRKVVFNPDGSPGVITTVVGNGVPTNWTVTAAELGDGGPATAARISPADVAVAPDGTLYVADGPINRVRRVAPDGIIMTIAGGGPSAATQDGIPATGTSLFPLRGIALGPDGSVYIAQASKVRKVTPDGLIWTIAGTGINGSSGDGGPATDAQLIASVLAVAPDGTLFIGDGNASRVRRVGSDGIISTVIGTGVRGSSGDNGPAAAAEINWPAGLAVDAQGRLVITDYNNLIRRHEAALPWLGGQAVIPSDDGREAYLFAADGRHLSTRDALTGAVRWQFTYDAGRLSAITDGDGNATTIERDAGGQPVAIVSPYGQRTTLGLDANGYLNGITNPASEAYGFTYDSGGLMQTMTDPRGSVWQFSYDDLGRLIRDADPVGGFKTLTRTDVDDKTYKVDVTTALARTTSYQIEQLPAGGELWTNTVPSGAQMTRNFSPAGITTRSDPDGTQAVTTKSPDPRFGMSAPLVATQTTTPGGLVRTESQTRSVVLSDPADVLSVSSLTDTATLNGRTSTSTYTGSNRTITRTSAAGRQSTTVFDAQGRAVQTQTANLAPVAITYDAQGRVASVTVGTGPTARVTDFAYDTVGQLGSILDAASRTFGFQYDPAGRVLSETLPDGRAIGYTYDLNGNLISLTPPGRSAHLFDYTAVNLEALYDPPAPAPPVTDPRTLYSYNADRQLTQITRPDGQVIDLVYDAAGRLSTQLLPNEQIAYGYDPSTQQLTSVGGPGTTTVTLAYDGNLPTRETWAGPVSGSVSRTYDNDFRVNTQSVNDASTINFGYDADSLLTASGAEALTRDTASGLLSSTALGVVSDSWTYDTFGQPATYTAAVSGSTVLSDAYTRDSLGRIIQKNETVQGVTTTYAYNYDLAGRLTDVYQNGNVISHYEYDTNGNRTAGYTALNGAMLGAVYNGQDRLLSYETTLGGPITYGYTANGELLTRTDGTGTTQYTYDVLGNLRSVTLPDLTLIEYVVDGKGRRIGKAVNGQLVQGFLYDGQLRVAAELDGNGSIVSRFAYGTKPNVPEYMVKGGATYRLVTDHLGSPRLVVNAADGTVAQRMEYDEFGNVLFDTNPAFQPFGFAGGLYDRDTELVRFGARDFDAETGRWTAKDPIRFDGDDTNLYGYVFADPVNLTDPMGLFGVPGGGGGGGSGFGGGAGGGTGAGGSGAGSLMAQAAPYVVPHFAPPAPAQPGTAPTKQTCISCGFLRDVNRLQDMARDLANSLARQKGERDYSKGRGDDPMYNPNTPDDEIQRIIDDPSENPARRKEARKVKKMRQQSTDPQSGKKCP